MRRPLSTHAAAIALALPLGLVVAVGACCTSRAPVEATAPPSAVAVESAPATGEGEADPGVAEGAPPASPVGGAQPSCERPPERNCCAAERPSCDRCRDAERREHEAWLACQTRAATPPAETIDCATPPTLQPCCRANLPKCYACVERNDALAAAWQQACER